MKNKVLQTIIYATAIIFPAISYGDMRDNCPEAKEVYVYGLSTLHFYTYNKNGIEFEFTEKSESSPNNPNQLYKNFKYLDHRYYIKTKKLECDYITDYESAWGDKKFKVVRTFTNIQPIEAELIS